MISVRVKTYDNGQVTFFLREKKRNVWAVRVDPTVEGEELQGWITSEMPSTVEFKTTETFYGDFYEDHRDAVCHALYLVHVRVKNGIP